MWVSRRKYNRMIWQHVSLKADIYFSSVQPEDLTPERSKTAAGVALTNALQLGTGMVHTNLIPAIFVAVLWRFTRLFPRVMSAKWQPSYPWHVQDVNDVQFPEVFVASMSPGGGLLTRSARFNHSCLPNVQGTWADGHAEWRALREISPGEDGHHKWSAHPRDWGSICFSEHVAEKRWQWSNDQDRFSNGFPIVNEKMQLVYMWVRQSGLGSLIRSCASPMWILIKRMRKDKPL